MFESKELRCSGNNLTELDLSAVPALRKLWCCKNKLTELDIRNSWHLKSVTVDPWVVVHKRPDQIVEHPE
jgi:Leucine-rich repeat (LRR) protein